MNKIQIAPSILSCNFLELGKEIEDVEKAGADLIHIDVMDGHFVPNITIGPLIVEAIKKIASKPLDVHLMIDNPGAFVNDFAVKGADIITIHAEADSHLFRTLEVIKSSGKKAGVSLNPSTPLAFLDHVIHIVDLIVIMTVNPGFGGQAYIPSMEEKIRNTRKMIQKSGREIGLEVDGGLKADNAKKIVQAGGDILVMGTEIFHSKDYKKKIQEVRKKIGP
jgi:ribulose-phosphate 3-epimerase